MKKWGAYFECVFDIAYLLFDLVAGTIFLLHGDTGPVFLLYGLLTLVLCFGDAFHLIPRVMRVLKGTSRKIEVMLGRGLQISSITMTVFYVLLLYIWKLTFNVPSSTVIDGIIWASAVIRVGICLLKKNDWCGKGNIRLSLIRNLVFLVTGLGIIFLYALTGNMNGYGMDRMVFAVILSFACYFPVTLFAKKIPAIGMLMMPKTGAYIWMIVMGLQLLSRY